jgi:hypothetical protein
VVAEANSPFAAAVEVGGAVEVDGVVPPKRATVTSDAIALEASETATINAARRRGVAVLSMARP